MKDVLILCAMGLEAGAIPDRYRVVKCGVGFRAARQSAERAIALYQPKWIVSVGTCVALDPALLIGDVRTVSKILSPLGTFTPHVLNATSVVLCSQDRVAVRVAEKRELFEQGASIVDMEAAVLAEACRERGLGFACLKAVSDLASEDLPLDFNCYRDADGRFQKARIAFAGIMKIVDLVRLKRQSDQAAKQLGAAIDASLANIT